MCDWERKLFVQMHAGSKLAEAHDAYVESRRIGKNAVAKFLSFFTMSQFLLPWEQIIPNVLHSTRFSQFATLCDRRSWSTTDPLNL